jgi:cell division protein FtsL
MSAGAAPGASFRLLRALFLALLLAAVGVFHVWSRTQVIATGYDLARLESEHRRLAGERDRLRLEISTLRAPGRLERFARTRLGMAPPAPGAVVAGVSGGRVLAGGVGGGGAGQRLGPAEPLSRRARSRPEIHLALRGPARTGSAEPR